MTDAKGPVLPELKLLSFSIIIPWFNAAQFITQTLLSIKKQGFFNVWLNEARESEDRDLGQLHR
jgi:hypothetical protein